MALPTPQDLYDEAVDELEGDDSTSLVVSPGSWLDALAQAGAIVGAALARRLGRAFGAAFIQGARTDEELDYVVLDRLGLTRLPGEELEAFRARALAWVGQLDRGTPAALARYVETVGADVAAYEVREDFVSGHTTIVVELAAAVADPDALLVQMRSGLSAWRAHGRPVSILGVV